MLNFVFILLSVLGTVGLYLGVPALSPWWILPILLGMFVATVFLYLLGLLVASIFLPMKKKIEKPNAYCQFMIWITMDWLMKLFRIRVNFKGRELLPNEPCVIISNHLSDFDPMAMLAILRERNLVYISKESNFKLPLVGRFIYNAGFIAIDRENGMRAVRTLHTAAETMKSTGVDIGIYPEGTRSKTGKLLRFKTGAFLLAQKANAPIVIMSTKGTERVSKNLPFRSTKVEMEILEVIDAGMVQEKTINELCDYAHSVVEKSLN